MLKLYHLVDYIDKSIDQEISVLNCTVLTSIDQTSSQAQRSGLGNLKD